MRPLDVRLLATSLVVLVGCEGSTRLVSEPSDPAPAGSASSSGGATVPACADGSADCDGDGLCETVLGTLSDCGGCGDACLVAGGQASCERGACVPRCDDGFEDCNGDTRDGCEAQLSSRRDHCGACDARCEAGLDCFEGHCLQILATVQAAVIGANALVVEEEWLYWTTPGVYSVGLDPPGQLARVAIGGGPTSSLITGLALPYGLRGNGAALFWSDAIAGGITRMALPEGSEEVVLPVDGAVAPHVLDVDATFVYFTTGADLQRVPVTGGASERLASGFVAVTSGSVRDGTFYFADLGPEVLVRQDGATVPTRPDGVLRRWSPAEGVVELANGLDTPTSVVTSGSWLLWAESGSLATYEVDGVRSNLGTRGRVVRSGLDGGGAEVIASERVHPGSLAVDATHVYWGNAGTVGGLDPELGAYEGDGSLERSSLAGGPVEVLVPAVDVHAVALSSDSVFMSSYWYGVVARVPKPR